MHEYVIDGAQFSTQVELRQLLIAIAADAGIVPEDFRSGRFKMSNTRFLMILDDVLGGWFNEQQTDEESWPQGKPDSFVIRWKNSSRSRAKIGGGKVDKIVGASATMLPGRWTTRKAGSSVILVLE